MNIFPFLVSDEHRRPAGEQLGLDISLSIFVTRRFHVCITYLSAARLVTQQHQWARCLSFMDVAVLHHPPSSAPL
jgi:hypothetical protein